MEKNEELAEKAYELCQQAYKNKDVELARVYLMNALTHNTELRYLKALVTIVKKTPFAARKEVAQQALNMFSMALFQAPADQIVEIRDLISEMQDIYDEAFAFDGSAAAGDAFAATTWNEFLNVYSWTELRSNGGILSLNKIQEKGSYLQKMLDSGSLTDEQRNKAEHEFKTTVSYIEYLTKEEALKLSLSDTEMELAGRKNLFYLAAKIQNVEALLSQLWLLNIEDAMPTERYRAILSDYAEKIGALEKRYTELKGQPLFDEIKAKLSSSITYVPKDGGEKKTPTLKRWQKLIQEVSTRMQELQNPDQLAELQKLLHELGAASDRLSRERYADYQAFCARQCKGAIKDFDNTGVVSASDAQRYLDYWDLAKIDETLLSPEASGMFHEAKAMLVDKLSRMDRADFQVKCVTAAKFSLEDF